MIKLVEINEDNWRPGLSVSEEQKAWVSDSNKLLARAYAYRNSRSRALLICDDETPIGMALYYDYDSLNGYDLSQLFIDQRYQGKGYASAALELILEQLRLDGKFSKVFLTYIEGNEVARRLYAKHGFIEGKQIEDEIFMERKL